MLKAASLHICGIIVLSQCIQSNIIMIKHNNKSYIKGSSGSKLIPQDMNIRDSDNGILDRGGFRVLLN